MSGVTFEGVTKRFGEVVAVDHLDLAIANGEFMVLVGPSGCGKSTALRMVAGLDEVTEGTLRIGDRIVNEIEPRSRDVAMVFQSYALYPHMTVFSNIEAPLTTRAVRVDGAAPRRLSSAERRRLVEDTAGTLGLEDLLRRKPGELSGGQRQRVALARAIVRRPEVFLLDEPLSNLDAKLRLQTRLELVELHRRIGTTFIHVTHDQVEAMTMGSRIAVMDHGRLQQVAPPQEIYDRPANLFVAGFMGSPPMNLLPGRVVSAPEGARIEVAGASFDAPAGLGASRAGEVVIGVRPEDLVLSGDATDPSSLSLRAEVRNSELLGHEQLVICRSGTEAVTVRLPSGTVAPAIGNTVSLRAPTSALHLFAADSGLRLEP